MASQRMVFLEKNGDFLYAKKTENIPLFGQGTVSEPCYSTNEDYELKFIICVDEAVVDEKKLK